MPKELKTNPCLLTAWAGSAFCPRCFFLFGGWLSALREPSLKLMSYHTQQGQDLALCCFVGLGSGFYGEERWEKYRTLHLSFSEGCCTMQLYIQDRKRGFGESGRKVAAVTSVWLGTLLGDVFPPSAHPLDRCPLLWLEGSVNTLNGEGKYCCSLQRQ